MRQHRTTVLPMTERACLSAYARPGRARAVFIPPRPRPSALTESLVALAAIPATNANKDAYRRLGAHELD